MTQIEMVEKLREKADVNYADAKDALERASWDLLDAMILLEREGKVKVTETAALSPSSQNGGGDYSTKAPDADGKKDSGKKRDRRDDRYYDKRSGKHYDKYDYKYDDRYRHPDGEKFKENAGKLFRWLCMVIGKGNVNMFVVEKNGEKFLPVPVTVLVILLLFGFWVVVPLIIIGLFFGFRYRFEGPDLGRDSVNSAMNKAANAAEKVKEEFKSGGE